MKCLLALAAWILVSGLDDLFIAIISLLPSREPFPWPSNSELENAAQRPIAILIPLWQEHRVIGQMLDRNLASIRYSNFEVFVGVYPNDALTMRAVSDAAACDPRIHVATLPHAGPTSKGDCLNWIYHCIREFESEEGLRFDIIVTHDAEDLMHPESLRLINWFSRDYQMVQIPVLALPTPLPNLTHGLYCDEFAEYQSKDIPVRQRLGGFLPANGVGTGFDRGALEQIAGLRGGRMFDPECLTEDYDTGYRLHSLGFRQMFVPLRFEGAGPVATREYFPRAFGPAVRQRSRWVAGIGLQGWQHHGWRVPMAQLYWLWRDRKGLLGNLLSPVANVVFLYGLTGHRIAHLPIGFVPIFAATLCLSVVQVGMRIRTTWRIYGARFAALVPVRLLWGNVINFLATGLAFQQFFTARLRRHRLAWRKTEHVYPLQASDPAMPRLGEVLVRMRLISREAVERAAANQPPSLRLGEYLVFLEHITEGTVYRALSVQAGIPLAPPNTTDVSRHAARALPAETARRWKVLPFRIDLGQLHLITPELPSEAMSRELGAISDLELRFRLVQPDEFSRLAETHLPAA